MQKYNLPRNPLKETKILQDIITLVSTNLKFQLKPKISSFKNPHTKIDVLLLPRGQNPLNYYTLDSMNLNAIGKTDKPPPKTVTISHVEEEYMGSRVIINFSISRGRWTGNYPQEDLARFGYR